MKMRQSKRGITAMLAAATLLCGITEASAVPLSGGLLAGAAPAVTPAQYYGYGYPRPFYRRFYRPYGFYGPRRFYGYGYGYGAGKERQRSRRTFCNNQPEKC